MRSENVKARDEDGGELRVAARMWRPDQKLYLGLTDEKFECRSCLRFGRRHLFRYQ